MYKLLFNGAGEDYASIEKDGRLIECLDGLYVDEQDKKDLQELVYLANNAAQQVQSDDLHKIDCAYNNGGMCNCGVFQYRRR